MWESQWALAADPDALRDAYGLVMRSLLDSKRTSEGEEVIFENDGAGAPGAADTLDLSDAKRGIAELTRWIEREG